MSVEAPVKPRLKTSAMIASIAAEGQRTVSAPFGHALAKLAETKQNIVGMSADGSRRDRRRGRGRRPPLRRCPGFGPARQARGRARCL